MGRPSHCSGTWASSSRLHRAEQPDERVVQVEPRERPVGDAVQRVEEPEPGDRREDDRSRPGQDHEEADDPLPAKSRTRKFERTAAPTTTIACEASVKISVFRSARRKFSSCQAFVKLSKPDPVSRQRAADGVREAEVDRPGERDADDERHEDDRRGDEQDREDAAALESVPPATPSRASTGQRAPPSDRPILVDSALGGNVAEIVLERLTKVYPDGTRAVTDLDLEVGRGRVRRVRRPVGLRKDDGAAHDRRARVDHVRAT